MKHLIVLIIALLLTGLSPALGYATPPPLLLGDAQSYSLAGHLEQLDDPGGKLTLADVLTPTMSSRFKPISGYMNRGYTRDAVWLRFKMERTALFPEQAYLCFMRTKMDYLVMGNILLDKTSQKPLDKDSDWLKEYELD